MSSVGVYPPGDSAQGVGDLAGNVWQWCLSKFDTPKDVTPAGDARRVVRGGSWNGGRGLARDAFRSFYHPGSRRNLLGFRVLCVFPILRRGPLDL